MIFSSLFELTKKDLKIFFRSKISSMFVILIPLLIVLFSGYAFNSSSMSNVNVAVYATEYNGVVGNIISGFEESGFVPTKYSSADECINSVKLIKSQICVVFPDNLNSTDIISEIVFYVDYSRINLADTLINNVKNSVSSESSKVELIMVQDLIDTLESTREGLLENKDNSISFFSDVKNNAEFTSSLGSPTEQIPDMINKLEDLKEDINSNDTVAINEVGELIVSLNEINDVGEKFSNDLSLSKKSQSDLVVKFDVILKELNNLTDLLNSSKIIKVENIISPINTRIEPINPESNKRDYLIPTLISIIAMFGSILLASSLIIKNKKTRAFFRNFMTPTKDFVFVLSTYFACLVILSIQFLFIFIGIRYILNVPTFVVSPELLVIMFASFSVFIFIGMFISYLFRSEETIIFVSMIVSVLFMFFSNTILPLENILPEFMKFAILNPLILSNLALKKVLLFGLGFGSIKFELLSLAVFSLLFLALTYIARRITRRML